MITNIGRYRQLPRSKSARKVNPFHDRFTVQTIRFRLAKLTNI